MAKYETPGVYVKEISLLPPSVAGVGTAIPAFIGYTEFAVKDKQNMIGQPIRINSLIDYERYFGMPKVEENITVTLKDILDENGNVVGVDSKAMLQSAAADAQKINPGASPFLMYYSLQMYFDNGGGPCHVLSVGVYNKEKMFEVLNQEDDNSITDKVSVSAADLTSGLNAIKNEDEPTLLVFPDAINLATSNEYYNLMKAGLVQCKDLQDRFSIMSLYSNTGNINDDATSFRNANLGAEVNELKYGAAYYPWITTLYNFYYTDDKVSIDDQRGGAGGGGGTGGGAGGGGNAGNEGGNAGAGAGAGAGSTLDGFKEGDTQAYNLAKTALNQLYIKLPPSSIMAGVYARVDRDRGVWKAPANVSLNSVHSLGAKINDNTQAMLNVDANSGKSINAIRFFTGKGILVWGARTLAGNDNEWRYINVRRFFNFAEESIKKSTSWAVFEPNDANTWVRVRAMIENFLTLQWRNGALQGATPPDAFFVKVGLGETMTAQDILEGRMNVEIGMAVVRPAEFIILKFSHKLAVS